MKPKHNTKLKVFTVVEAIHLGPIIIKNAQAPSFQFRIDILKERGTRGPFHARVYRCETFRIQPTFPSKDGEPRLNASDEHILVEDATQDWENFKERTANRVLEKVLKKIQETLDF